MRHFLHWPSWNTVRVILGEALGQRSSPSSHGWDSATAYTGRYKVPATALLSQPM